MKIGFFAVPILLVALAGCSSAPASSSSDFYQQYLDAVESNSVSTPSPTPSPTPCPAQVLSGDLGISEPLAQSLVDVAAQLGIDDLSDCYSEDSSLVFIPYEGYQFAAISFDGQTVSQVYESNLDVFLYRDDQVVDTFDALFATESQKVVLANMIPDDVSPYLKSPSTASFPGAVLDLDQYRVTREGDSWTVTSYVDSQNSFGATGRTVFTATYLWDGELTSLPVFSGVEFQE